MEMNLFSNRQPVEQALGLLNRVIAILDSENMAIAAAKVDEARCAIRSAGQERDDEISDFVLQISDRRISPGSGVFP